LLFTGLPNNIRADVENEALPDDAQLIFERSTLKNPFLKSIRMQLLLLIFAAMLPPLSILIYANYEHQRQDLENARSDILRVMQGLANEHESTVEMTGRFLMTLARMPAVVKQDAPACRALFRELLRDNNLYANIYAADRAGMVFASALPAPKVVIKGRKYFQHALEKRTLAAGEYIVGPVSQRAVLPFAYPLVTADGRLQGVVAVSLDLEKYGQSFAALPNFPKGATINLLDRSHIRLYRHPYREEYTGKADLPEIVKEISSGPAEGIFEAAGADGVHRLFAYKRFYLPGEASPYLYLRVGIPREQIMAATRRNLYRNMTLLGVSLLAAVLAAWLLGNNLIAKRLRRLAETSRRLEQGDFTARTGMGSPGGEIGQLARSFDELAAKLRAKEEERRQTEAELRLSRDRYQAFVTNSSEAICRFEIAGAGIDLALPPDRQIELLYQHAVIGECNRLFAVDHGYDDQEAMAGFHIGQVYPRLSKETVGFLRQFLLNGCKLSGVETKTPARDGTVKYFLNNMIGHTEDGRLIRIWISRQDITRSKLAEEALRKSEAQLNRLIEALSVAVLIHNRGRIIYVNQAFLKLFRASAPAEVIGLRITDYVAPELLAAIGERERAMVAENRPVPSLEFNLRCLDGTHVTVVSTPMPMIYNEKPVILTALYDITERKRQEIELQKAHLLLKNNYHQIEQLQIKLKEQAIRDPLTGLYNRRYLEESTDRELSRAHREGFAIGAIMIDIDRFKRINDRYGHKAGDLVIQSLATLLGGVIRAEDIACRYGGEEFLLILPKAGKEIAAARADQLRRAFAEIKTGYDGNVLQAEISLGVAAYPDDGITLEEVIKAADQAMYRAKSLGRNRVEIA